MPRISTGEKRVRLNLEISESVRDRIEGLREESGAESLTEVIRKALSAYEFLIKHKKNKGKIILIDQNNKEKELEILV